jgi:hypothetical protein
VGSFGVGGGLVGRLDGCWRGGVWGGKECGGEAGRFFAEMRKLDHKIRGEGEGSDLPDTITQIKIGGLSKILTSVVRYVKIIL